MTLTPADPAIPDHAVPDLDPESLATISVINWLREDQAAAEECEDTLRADTYRRETRRRKEAATRAMADANARLSNLMDKIDLEGRRFLGFGLGTVIILGLITLDAIPLNWAAQAFGLNAADSWLVTLILLVASVGAMVGLEVTRNYARRRSILIAIIITAYIGLMALRASYLVTVAGESLPAGLLQASVLSAISAGLVVLGSAVMARTRPLGLSRARAAARRARRISVDCEAECRRAEERVERHFGVLRRQLVRQPLYSAIPAGATHPEWVAALERALRRQLVDQ